MGEEQTPCNRCGKSDRWVEGRCKPCTEGDRRLRVYGITAEVYDAAVKTGCPICAHPFVEGKVGKGPAGRSPTVDHYELPDGSPVVRGVLCSKCNLGIGYLDHDADTLRRAAEYILRSTRADM